jgi:uncharacterized protein
MYNHKNWKDWLWNAWCVASIVGIWPRFIEPHLLATSLVPISIKKLPASFNGFRILQFSDLHWDIHFSKVLLWQIKRKIKALKPDMIVFTGDLITRSKIENKETLQQFLSSFKAPAGCFAILGNHDYAQYVCLNKNGDYDIDRSNPEANIVKGFRRLFTPIVLTRKVTDDARSIKMHQELAQLFKETGFNLLTNETVQISSKGDQLNLCGVEEYTTGRLNPEKAFANYKKDLPGIILTHNPDSVTILQDYPGDLILSGHTHGGEINLPYMWKKFCIMENPSLKKGLKRWKDKQIYINRGITSIMKFRWFAMPELTLFSLKDET